MGILLESADDVRRWSPGAGSGPGLATSPGALLEAHRRRLPVRSTYAFGDREEMDWYAARIGNWVPHLCEEIDRGLATDEEPLRGFRPFRAAAYQIKHFLDAAMFRWLELRSASTALDVGTFQKPAGDPGRGPPPGSGIFQWTPDQSAALALLHGPGQRGTGAGGGPSGGAADRLPSLNPNALVAFRALGTGAFLRPQSGRPILVLNTGREVVKFLRSSSSAVDWWTTVSADPVALPWLRTIRLRRGAGARDDVLLPAVLPIEHPPDWIPPPVRAVLEDRLRRYLLERVPELRGLFARAVRYCEVRRPALAVSGATTADSIQVVGQACDVADVPLVAFQHGGNYGYVRLDDLRLFDLSVPTVFCTYGRGVTETLAAEASSHGTTRLATVGYANALSGQRSMRRPRTGGAARSVLYIPTAAMGDNRYGPKYWYDDTEYFLRQVALVRTLARVGGGISVTLKLHYKEKGPNPLVAYLQDRFPGWANVERGRGIASVLRAADVVLVDWPSTVLLEALSSGRPLVYLDHGWLEWYPEARELLKKECLWLETHRPWRRPLREALAEPLNLAAPPGVFLERYGRPAVGFDELWCGPAPFGEAPENRDR